MKFWNNSRREHFLLGTLTGVLLAVATYVVTVLVAG